MVSEAWQAQLLSVLEALWITRYASDSLIPCVSVAWGPSDSTCGMTCYTMFATLTLDFKHKSHVEKLLLLVFLATNISGTSAIIYINLGSEIPLLPGSCRNLVCCSKY